MQKGILAIRPKHAKFLALVLALILLCIAPMVSGLYTYSRTHVEVEREGIRYASVKNTTVTQQIYCEGRISNLGIAFYAPSGRLYGDAEVRITLSQGARTVTECVKAAKLRTLSAYEKDPETQMEERSRYEMTYVLRTNLGQFSKGEATISVTSDNLPEGTDLFCEVSSTLVSGLPSAMAGENILGSPMVVEYDVLRSDAHFWYETALLALLVILLVATAWLLAFRQVHLERYNILFCCAFAIIFVVVSIRNPYASFWGEPRSEAAYEFWYKAENMGLFGSMMSLMSGEALAWWERILMWLANTVSPRKYVFVTAQLMELTWIALVSAMPCLNHFRKFFCDEIRLAVSLLLGTALLFDSAYYFWSCSYWALLFILLFTLLPLEKLRSAVYWSGLALTVILGVSRIYHILLVPVAVAAAFLLGKRQGRRFSLYCWTVAGASAFEVLYSLVAGSSLASGSSPIQNLSDIGLGRMLENTLYYQMQVINSFFTGASHWQGSGANALAVLLFAAVVSIFVYAVVRRKRELACLLGGLGFISLGSIAVNVYTSGSFAEVAFPRNYANEVNWGKTVYQEADLHFSYAYICLVFLLLVLVYLAGRFGRAKVLAVVRSDCHADVLRAGTALTCAGMILTFCASAAFNVKPRLSYNKISVEWKSIYQITEQDCYFAAINTFYGAAPISLEQGTDEMIFGVDADGVLYEWKEGLPAYELDSVYHEANIGEISSAENRPILSVTARRALTNFDVIYVAVLRDRSGRELARATQAGTDGRLWLDFLFPEPVSGVYSISFELSDGSIAYVQDALQVGYVLDKS